MRMLTKGFTLFELIVVICIVAILATTLLNRVSFYQEQAEKAAMEQIAGAVQSALTLQYASLVTRGRENEIAALATENPMNWLAKKPNNYAGEFFEPTLQTVAPGNWVFDLKSRNLVYRVDRGEHFTPGKDGELWVRYRVNLLHETKPEERGRAQLAGVILEPAEPYRWFERSLP